MRLTNEHPFGAVGEALPGSIGAPTSILAGLELASDLVEVSNRNLAKAQAEGAIELPTNSFDVMLLAR